MMVRDDPWLGDVQGCHILFSTQSGRAKACARRCSRLIRERTNFRVLNRSGRAFDDDIQQHKQCLSGWCTSLKNSKSLLILFVSTTGDGEHTDTILVTWKLLLQKSLSSDLFQGIPFAIFSLGDRAYGPNFSAAGRKLAVRLMQLGAKMIGQPGYGDDGTPNGGVFADLDQWMEDVLLKTLCNSSKYPDEIDSLSTATPHTPYRVSINKSLPLQQPSSPKEEWQHDKFSSAYQAFFARMASVTTYRYDKRTLERTTDDKNNESLSTPLVGVMVANRRITAEEHDQNTRHIELEIKPVMSGVDSTPSPSVGAVDYASKLPYHAGDIASVLPSNSPQQVERFLQVIPEHVREIADYELELQYDHAVEPTAGVGFPYWPCCCTLRGWLTFCADIHALPEREDLRALSHFCCMQHEQGPDQQAKLRSLSETSETALYADYVLREKRSWADVLYDFDSIRAEGSSLTVEFLMSLLSPIRPRDFSIASSPTERHLLEVTRSGSLASSPCIKVGLCVAVVEGTTPLGRKYHGLCSEYLSRQLVPIAADNEKSEASPVAPSVRLWIKPGSFRGLSTSVVQDETGDYRMSAPLLCIGAGTGVAPLRGLLREREAVRRMHVIAATTATNSDNPAANGDVESVGRAQNNIDERDRDNILVFGCRKRACDFYYHTEWEELTQRSRLTLFTAFSRDQWHKIYVQQILQKAEEEGRLNLSRHLLERTGSIYIAGSPSMARTVKEVIVELLVRTNPCLEEKQVLSLLSKLQRQGRFGMEAWG